jgi:hypothetical protein
MSTLRRGEDGEEGRFYLCTRNGEFKKTRWTGAPSLSIFFSPPLRSFYSTSFYLFSYFFAFVYYLLFYSICI